MSGDFLLSPLMVRLQGYDLKALEPIRHLLAVILHLGFLIPLTPLGGGLTAS
jgi:hypothetical protein